MYQLVGEVHKYFTGKVEELAGAGLKLLLQGESIVKFVLFVLLTHNTFSLEYNRIFKGKRLRVQCRVLHSVDIQYLLLSRLLTHIF